MVTIGVGRKMSKFPGRFEIIRDYSLGAAVKFQDESLDYVYIDARHDYAGVKVCFFVGVGHCRCCPPVPPV